MSYELRREKQHLKSVMDQTNRQCKSVSIGEIFTQQHVDSLKLRFVEKQNLNVTAMWYVPLKTMIQHEIIFFFTDFTTAIKTFVPLQCFLKPSHF